MNIETASVIKGWMGIHELYWLATQARKHFKIAEIGCAYGRSTRALADNGAFSLFAIDTWNGSPGELHTNHIDYSEREGDNTFIQFCNNLWMHIYKGAVIPIRMHSHYAAELFASQAMRFDMVFIDGWHAKEGVLQDITDSMPLVRQGGIIAGHDYGDSNWPGVQEAVDELIPDAQVAPLTRIWYKEIPYA